MYYVCNIVVFLKYYTYVQNIGEMVSENEQFLRAYKIIYATLRCETKLLLYF